MNKNKLYIDSFNKHIHNDLTAPARSALSRDQACAERERTMPKKQAVGSAKSMSMAELIAEERRKRGMPAAAATPAAMPKPEQLIQKKKKKKKQQQQKAITMPTEEELARLRRRDDDESEDEEDVAVAAAVAPESLAIAPQLVEYTDTRVGQGTLQVMLRSNVVVEYTGRLASDGHVFDKSKASTPLRFTVGSDAVVEGFEDGMLGMRLGGERRIHVTPELGYGSEGLAACKIPPNASLQFDVRLIGLS